MFAITKLMMNYIDWTQQMVGAVAVGAATAVVGIFSIWKISTPQGLWISMNQFQMILLLLLTKCNIPKRIENYLNGLKATTWSFNFIPFKDIPGLNKLVSYFDFPLSNSSLDEFGVFSGSTFANNFALIWILILISVIVASYILISKLWK